MTYIAFLKKYRIPFTVLLAVQLIILGNAWTNQHIFTNDSAEYLQQARNIMYEGHWSCAGENDTEADVSLHSRRPPGYAIFIILTSAGLNLPLLTLLIQCLLSVFNLTFSLNLLVKATGKKPPGILIAAFFVFFPSQFIYATQFMTEIPFQTSLLLGAFFLIEFLQGRSTKIFMLQQLCWLSAYLLKPVALLIWIPAWMVCALKEGWSANRTAMLGGAALHILVIGLSIFNNYRHTGAAEYSSIGTKLLVNYNLPAIIRNGRGEAELARYMDSLQNQLATREYATQRSIIIHETINQAIDHPSAAIAAHVKGFIRFFIDPCRWDIQLFLEGNEPENSKESLIDLFKSHRARVMVEALRNLNPLYLLYVSLTVITTTVLTLLFFLSLLRNHLSFPGKYLLAGIVFYIALMTGPSASARFRVPVFPLIVVIAATCRVRRAG